MNELDATWLSTLTTYGTLRGAVAHTSANTQNIINIQEVSRNVHYIINGIEEFEKELERQIRFSLYRIKVV